MKVKNCNCDILVKFRQSAKKCYTEFSCFEKVTNWLSYKDNRVHCEVFQKRHFLRALNKVC